MDKFIPKISSKELEMGVEEEMEHTDDPKKSRQIALDHLEEDPKYYTKLKKCMPKEALEGSGYADPRDGSTNTTSRSTSGQETQFSAPDIPEAPEDKKKKEKKYMTVTPPKKEVVEVEEKKMAKYVKAMECPKCGDEYWQGDQCPQCQDDDEKGVAYYNINKEIDVENLLKSKQDLVDNLVSFPARYKDEFSHEEDESLIDAGECHYCGEKIKLLHWPSTYEGGVGEPGQVWIDKTGGDVCSGNDEGENEHENHEPFPEEEAMSVDELKSIFKKSRREEKKVQTCIDLVEGKVHNVKTARLWKDLTESLKSVVSLKKTAQTEEWENPYDAAGAQINYNALEDAYNEYAKTESPGAIYWKLQQDLIQNNTPKEQAKQQVDSFFENIGVSPADESSPIQDPYRPDVGDIFEQYDQPQERGEKASDYIKDRPGEEVKPKQFSDRQHMKSMMDRNQIGEGGTYESKPQIKIREMAAYSQSPKLRQKIQKQNPELAKRMENYMSRKVGGLGEAGRQLFAKDPANFWKLVHRKPGDKKAFEAAAQQFASTGEMPLQSLSPGQAKRMPQLKDVKTAPAPGSAGSYELPTQEEQLATNREKFTPTPPQTDQPTMEAIPAGYSPVKTEQDKQRERAREQADIGYTERMKDPERSLPPEELKKREEKTEKLHEKIGTPAGLEHQRMEPKPEEREMVDVIDPRAVSPEPSGQKTIEGPDITQEKLDVDDPEPLELAPRTEPEAKVEELEPEAVVPGQPSGNAVSKLSNAMEDPETGRTNPEYLPTGGWNQEKAKKIFTPEAFKEVFKDSFVIPKESKDKLGKYMNYDKQMNNWKNPLSKGLWESFMETFGHGPKVKDEEKPEVKTRSQRAKEFINVIKDNGPLFKAFKKYVEPHLQRKEVREEDKVDLKLKDAPAEVEVSEDEGLGQATARLRTVTSSKLIRGELINGPEWLHRVASTNKYLPVGDYACVLLTNKLIAVRLPDSHKAKNRMRSEEVRELYKSGAPTWAIPR